MKLHALLRWAAGGSYLDIRLTLGISKNSFYRIAHECIDAIRRIPQLAIDLPKKPEELEKASNDFTMCSSHGIISGCVACVDGMLLRIQQPPSASTGHVKSYFSGHYQDYGINVQAACDSHCRFLYVKLASPGGTNDVTAFRKTSLYQFSESLPLGKYIIGDNAYVCTEHVLTPFPGEDKNI